MLNVYFKTINKETLSILRVLRGRKYEFVKYWYNNAGREHFEKYHIRDAKKIDYLCGNNPTVYSLNNSNGETLSETDRTTKQTICRIFECEWNLVCIDDISQCQKQMAIFQEDLYETEYPEIFVRVPCFNTFEDLIRFAFKQGEPVFTLDDTNHFVKCGGFFEKGAQVYREIETGRYWHLDTFHNNHFEVYDKNGHHIGEADTEGELDRSKKGSTKKLNLH